MHAFRFRSLIQPIALALIGSTALVAPGYAQTTSYWDTLTGSWGVDANWSGNRQPTQTDTAFFGDDQDYSATLDGQAFSVANLILLENGVISNGTLTVGSIVVSGNAMFDSALNVNLAENALISFTNNRTLNVLGRLSPAETLLITGPGTLALQNGRIDGSISVEDTTLQTGYQTSGFVSGNVDLQGSATLSSGGNLTIGSLSGNGTVDLNRMPDPSGPIFFPGFPGPIQFADDSDLTVGTDNTDSTFAGTLLGTGTFKKIGTGTLTLESSNGLYTGAMSVLNGTLRLKSGLGISDVAVASMGQLSGAGQIDSLDLYGTLSPDTPFALQSFARGRMMAAAADSSIGTMEVNGAVTFQSSNSFIVDVDNAGNSDQINARSAQIRGGTVEVRPLAGTYNPSTTYTIVRTEDGLTGIFAGALVNNLAFLTPTLSYTPNEVLLRLDVNPTTPTDPTAPTQPGLFPTAARTGNQAQAASGAESLSAGNPLYDAILVQTNAGAEQAYSLLSSEPFASQSGVFQQASAAQRGVALDRAREGSNAVTPDGAVMSYVDDGNEGRALSAGDRTVWGGVYGNRSTLDGNTNAAAINSGSGGFQAGADDWFGDFRLGVMINAGRTGMTANDRNFSSTSNDYGIGIYGGTQIGATSIAIGAGYQRHDITSQRNVAFPGFNETLNAGYAAGAAQLFGEIAHSLDVGAVTISPYAQLAYVSTHTDGFTETGGASALTVAGRSENSVFTTLGARVEGDFVLGNDMVVKATGALGWRHAFADTPTSTASFGGGQSFSATGSPIAKDALVLEAGLKTDIATNVSLALNYGGQFASDGNDQTISAKLAVKF